MVGHFLLQGTDVCWERRGAQTLLDSCDPFIESFVIVRFRLPTMYQVFTFRNVWKQLVECFVVLHETLQERRAKKVRMLQVTGRQWGCREQLSTYVLF